MRKGTYTGGRGQSVIDYIIGDNRARERIEKMVVEERVYSDHLLIVAWLEGASRGGREKEKGKLGRRRRGRWTREGIERFVR